MVPTIASNVLLERFARHPFTHLRRKPMDKRRLAEFMQIIQQLIAPKSIEAEPFISFGPPFSSITLEAESGGRRLMPAVLDRVRTQLTQHMSIFEG